MKKILLPIALSIFLSACATVDYQPYEGTKKTHLGEGGTKLVTNGIDFWANGEPNRKYQILGIAVSEVGSGFGDEGLIRSSVSKEVIKQGGNAAIQLTNNERVSGAIKLSPTLYGVANTKQIKFAVVKYID